MSKQKFYEMIVAYHTRNNQFDMREFQGVTIEKLVEPTKELHKEGKIIYEKHIKSCRSNGKTLFLQLF